MSIEEEKKKEANKQTKIKKQSNKEKKKNSPFATPSGLLG